MISPRLLVICAPARPRNDGTLFTFSEKLGIDYGHDAIGQESYYHLSAFDASTAYYAVLNHHRAARHGQLLAGVMPTKQRPEISF